MTLTKKYFSISEVAEISCLPAHKLRYIEKSDPNIEIVKIRDRRYYTKDNIDYIKKTYPQEKAEIAARAAIISSNKILEITTNQAPQIIFKINALIANFSKLAEEISNINLRSTQE